ncbi:MAG: hypothetical protein ISR20_05970 [Candidatus Poseidonia sp.]|nr:hypothetical protein [Poseidonia sp.]
MTDRPRGKPLRKACGLTQFKTSKHALGTKNLQANCKACGRKARLNPSTRKCYTYESKEAAETHCRAMNEHGVDLTPTKAVETPQTPHNLQELTGYDVVEPVEWF